MNEKFLTKPYVDHFIQAQIIQELSNAENPIRFSDLKESDIDNSLFMYHANKLINRGLLEKVEDGFQLTTKGARWSNHFNDQLFSPELLPRPLIQFIITSEDRILLGKRVGSMKKYLNKYLIPGGLHIYGKTAQQSAEEIIKKVLKNENNKLDFISFVEYLVEYPDYTHHSLANIFRVEVDDPVVNDQSGYHSQWVKISDINKDNDEFKDDNLLLEVIQRIPKISNREIFYIKQDN